MNLIQEAAERRRSHNYMRVTTGNPSSDPKHWPIEDRYWQDAQLLADAYLADQAAKAAAEAEGATLIDRDALLARGFRASGEACAWMYTKGLLSVFGVIPTKPHEGTWHYGDTPIPPFSTCGQLDAVIAVLCKG